MYLSISRMTLSLNWMALVLIGNFLYLNIVMSLASSTSMKKVLNFSRNLEKSAFPSLCSNSCRKTLVFLDYPSLSFSLSSRYSPYFFPKTTDCLKSSTTFFPGITSLKVFACPKTILSRCCSNRFYITNCPLTNNFASLFGTIYIYPFSWMIEQCLLLIPREFSFISFY